MKYFTYIKNDRQKETQNKILTILEVLWIITKVTISITFELLMMVLKIIFAISLLSFLFE